MGTGRREVLLCISGLTPQVITETLYALAVEARESKARPLPDEIRLITTTEGRRRARLALFSHDGGHGFFHRLCRDYELDAGSTRFSDTSIEVVRDARGNELEDIVAADDNSAAADLITARVRELTRDPQTRLHVSLAGGRKTMGFYAGYALSLYGRPQDRLTHVLVNRPFESHPSFFYPPPEPQTLLVDGGRDYVSTADARVVLADIPFVRLLDELDGALRDDELSFTEAVARAQRALERPHLVLDIGERAVWLQGQRVTLSPTQFAWLVWFADRARRGAGPTAFDEAAAEELLEIVYWLEGCGSSPLADAVSDALAEMRASGESNYFDRNRSRLNRALTASGLPRSVVERYQVRATGRRPNTRYGLGLAPEAIEFRGEP